MYINLVDISRSINWNKRCFLFYVFLSFFRFIHFNFPLNRFRRQANGCGPINLNIDRFLRELGEEMLIECCNQHDLCYDTCGKKQFTCDTIFFDCMFEACQQLSSISDIIRCKDTGKNSLLVCFLRWSIGLSTSTTTKSLLKHLSIVNKIKGRMITRH